MKGEMQARLETTGGLLAGCRYQAVGAPRGSPVSALATGRYLARMATIAAASALETGGNGDT